MSTLTLIIGGQTYNVEVHPYSHVRLTRHNDPTGLSYDVLFPGFDCPASCDCPDYRYRRQGLDYGGCKHVRALTDLGLIPLVRVGSAIS